jgi:hypothetical protein
VVRWRTHRSAFRSRILVTLTLLAALAALDTVARARESLTGDEAQYEAETDPVRKAKTLGKLGPREVDEARKDLSAGQDEKALAVLEHYRDEVRETDEGLAAAGLDAERHPSGFKELQIGLRETIRHLDDLILSLPSDKRPWFRAVRSDLVTTQNSLIDALFPAPAAKGAKKEKPR